MSLGVIRAGVYTRISDDRQGEGLGIARQLEDCERAAEALGWTIVDRFPDNDISAFDPRKRRAQYHRLLAALRSGEIDAVLAWHPERLHRSPLELEEFIPLFESGDRLIHTVQTGVVDLSTPAGRAMARNLVTWARYESEHKSARIRRKMVELAERGKVSGGGSRPFGFEDDRVTLREAEAAVVRDLVGRLLAGESLRGLLRWLADERIPTTEGKTWTATTLRRLLRSARISGQREHHGQITATAEWPAIITPDQTARIRALLDDPSRRLRRTPRRYLLTGGTSRCGRCGHKLVGRPRGDGRGRYVCPTAPIGAGCGKVFVLADDLDTMVYRAVLIALDGPDLQQTIAAAHGADADAAALQQEAAALSARREDLGSMFALGEIDRSQLLAGSRAIDAQLTTVHRMLAAVTRTEAFSAYLGNGDNLATEWDDLTIDRQRAVVGSIVEQVSVGPAVRGRNYFDPSRVDITWRY